MPIAQINVSRFRKAKADPANQSFMDALDRVNAQADVADGFIWRLVGEGDANDATAIQVIAGDADFIVNLSVWRDVPALEAFAYRQADHRSVLARRAEWFDAVEPSLALWEVPAGYIPTVAEALDMLAQLGREGPSAAVFTFKWWRENR
ncbi:DUF3291 domain-containing protein [Novosphingobium sp. PASSN1]|uniref:DUF3291 domain-containing protein n=1 Tax=Novosphingobium sp. PASSN1 TaxID=2015561 RepID=UPI000BC73120|nr:DUF3291 domain-containing protein [Novosphingobium sp. PASSN1]OYU34580.1 MAG: hypothetical protein CFE35_14445 [Novosphingobium sp. PASSN1]